LKQATDYAALEDEYRKLGSNRPLVDKYKEQMAQMEARLTDLTADKQRLELELAALRTEHTLAAQQKSRDQEHIAALEEKLHELELQQGVTADGGLQAELTGSATADLKLQISRLQQDNARLKQEQLAAESLRNELEVERAKVVALRRQLTDRDSGERVSSTADAERLASLEAGQKRQLETINRLLVEKDSLQNELLATKDQLLTQERSNA
jgi:protein HOOK3